MRPVNALIWVVLAAALLFLVLNWSTPIPISFGFTRVTAPLGLVLLGLLLVLGAIALALLLTQQMRLVAMHRRHSEELRTHRELAEDAEASRYSELRQYLQQQLEALAEAQQQSEQRLHEELQSTSNALSACIGEIDERLERQWPSAPSTQP